MTRQTNENIQPRSAFTTFSIKDVVTIIVAVVAVASAFFMYDTRIAVIENDMSTLRKTVNDTQNLSIKIYTLESDIKLIQNSLHNTNKNLEYLIDQSTIRNRNLTELLNSLKPEK